MQNVRCPPHSLIVYKLVLIAVTPQTPTLSLVPVVTPKRTSVMCVIEDFYPKNLIVQWKVNNNITSQLKPESKQNKDTGLYTAYSFYEVSSETWHTKTDYTCEVTHQKNTIPVTKNFEGKSFNADLLSLVHALTSVSNSHKDIPSNPIHRYTTIQIYTWSHIYFLTPL